MQSCNQIAAFAPNITFKFVGDTASGSASTFKLDITPAFYLFQNSSSGFCQYLVNITTDTNVPYILGQPFFRQYTTQFNYSDNTVGIVNATSSVSPIVAANMNPTASAANNATSILTSD